MGWIAGAGLELGSAPAGAAIPTALRMLIPLGLRHSTAAVPSLLIGDTSETVLCPRACAAAPAAVYGTGPFALQSSVCATPTSSRPGRHIHVPASHDPTKDAIC